MNPFIDRAIWFLTGGRELSVHSVILKKRKSEVHQFEIPHIETQIRLNRPSIETKVNKQEDRVSINRMAFEGIRPVQSIILFHTINLPVLGLTMPSIRVITRIRRFTPKLLINSLKIGMSVLINEIQKLPKSTNVMHEKYKRILSSIIPVPTLRQKIKVSSIQPNDIPDYFIRIRPVSFLYLKPIEIATRRIIFAKTLGVPKEMVHLLAIFRDIEKVSHERLQFDESSSTLICRIENDDEQAHKICDILVGVNLMDNKLHILLYKR